MNKWITKNHMQRWTKYNFVKTAIFLLFCFISVNAVSQRFKGGLLAGIAATQVDGDTYAGFDKAGIIAGGFVNLPIKTKVDLQLELKFIEKGSKNIPKNDVGDYYNLRLQYAEMPFLGVYHVDKRFSVDGGLAFGYLFTSKEKFGYDGIETINSKSFAKIDISAMAGVYYTIVDNLKANVRFSYSLKPIRGITDLPYLKRGQFNRVICMSIYYWM